MRTTIISILTLLSLSACNSNQMQKETPKNSEVQQAILAGGCFWCVEAAYDSLPGVKDVESGYSGGQIKDPTYKQVSSGTTGHKEVVRIDFDPSTISFEDILQVYWRQIDPTDADGSFVDRGLQYSAAIYYLNEEQKKAATELVRQLETLPYFTDPIAIEILPAAEFYAAEEYHQDYHIKNPIRYKFYRSRSGRDQFRKNTYGDDMNYQIPIKNKAQTSTEDFEKPDETTLRQILTPLQYKVTQEDGTEKPFNNEYWDNKEEGIYVDIVSGEPLFSSTHKYKSGTGWPSFWQPINTDYIATKTDRKLFIARTEVRSKQADSHLGHVFSDGPEPTGLRYCMNSAAMKFIPKEQMKEQGYEKYLSLFE